MAGGVTDLEPCCGCAGEQVLVFEAPNGGDRDFSGMLGRRRHGSQKTGMAYIRFVRMGRAPEPVTILTQFAP
jgi:hypothetical protein